MKKKLAVLTATLLALGMAVSGCSNGPSAEEQFQAALDKSAALTSMDSTVTTTSTMTVGEDSMEIGVDLDLKITDLNTESMKMSMIGTTSMMDTSFDMASYYSDGYFYMEMMGQKMKTPMDLEGAMAQVSSNTALADMAKDVYKDIKMTESGDNKVFSYIGDTTKLKDYTDEVLASTAQSIGATGTEDMTMTIDKMEGTVTVNKDGDIVAQNATMNYTMTVQGQEMKMEMVMDMVMNNPGQAVEIELPDLTDFQEVEPATMGLE